MSLIQYLLFSLQNHPTHPSKYEFTSETRLGKKARYSKQHLYTEKVWWVWKLTVFGVGRLYWKKQNLVIPGVFLSQLSASLKKLGKTPKSWLQLFNKKDWDCHLEYLQSNNSKLRRKHSLKALILTTHIFNQVIPASIISNITKYYQILRDDKNGFTLNKLF